MIKLLCKYPREESNRNLPDFAKYLDSLTLKTKQDQDELLRDHI